MTYEYQKALRDEGARIELTVETAFFVLDSFMEENFFSTYWNGLTPAQRDKLFNRLLEAIS
jgi:hypothetical protein